MKRKVIVSLASIALGLTLHIYDYGRHGRRITIYNHNDNVRLRYHYRNSTIGIHRYRDNQTIYLRLPQGYIRIRIN
ncbi:MAG: hypothetical protein J7L43_01090 [Candidatus Aenigmarchaeota archaeon]|nr:hypothetical protein [Candidatus Aenigmarchaeota archaeon]